MTLNFEQLTIEQLRKLTEQYEKLIAENKILKTVYPNKLRQALDEENKTQTAEDILKEL